MAKRKKKSVLKWYFWFSFFGAIFIIGFYWNLFYILDQIKKYQPAQIGFIPSIIMISASIGYFSTKYLMDKSGDFNHGTKRTKKHRRVFFFHKKNTRRRA